MGITVINQAAANHGPLARSSKGRYGSGRMMSSSSTKVYGRIYTWNKEKRVEMSPFLTT